MPSALTVPFISGSTRSLNAEMNPRVSLGIFCSSANVSRLSVGFRERFLTALEMTEIARVQEATRNPSSGWHLLVNIQPPTRCHRAAPCDEKYVSGSALADAAHEDNARRFLRRGCHVLRPLPSER